MSDRDLRQERNGQSPRGTLSRRDFLKVAGVAGATLGIGAGLGSLAAACGEAEEGTTTSSTAAETSTTTAGATTTVSAGPEAGREIRVGVVAPLTGVLASFGPPVEWSIPKWEAALADGIVAGDGKLHKFVWIMKDTQSDSNRSAQVTGDLIQNDKVDVVFSGGSPDNVNPSADQCEAQGVPSLSCFVPWQGFVLQRGGKLDGAFKWTYATALGAEQLSQSYLDVWDKQVTNKKAGIVLPNNANGLSLGDMKTGYPAVWKAGGYEIVFPDFYQPGSEDFTQQITEFKREGCEVCYMSAATPDITNFWQQALQQGFHPKIMSTGLGLSWPESAMALGDPIIGTTAECAWHPDWPFVSSLTGETCRQAADDYTEWGGRVWSPGIGQYARMEWLVDALKRTPDVDDKEALINAIASTKMDTLYGPIDYTAPVKMGTFRPHANISMPPIAVGQWKRATSGDWPYEFVQVSNKWAPGTTAQEMVLVEYK